VDIVIGVLGLLAGAAVCSAGLRLFAILLPIWGLIVGFLFGAGIVSAIFGDGFLATTLGIVIGIISALIFAALSYLYWYVGVLLAATVAGGILGASLFATFGVDSGWLLFIIGVIFGALFLILAFIGRFPIVLVAISTAISGSAIAIGGALLLFNQIDRDELSTSALWERINDSWYLWIIWLVAAAIGFGVQIREAQSVLLPEDRWTPVNNQTAGTA